MKKVILYIFIFLLFISCNRNYDIHYHLTSAINVLGNFNKGSYWIYHNDSLNISDTISIIDYKMGTSLDNGSYLITRDILTIKLKSNFCDSIIDNLESFYYSRSYYGLKNNIDSTIRNFIIYTDDNNNYYADSASFDFYYNYKLNGMLFDKVVCYTFGKLKNKYYFALNTGIIKIIMINNSKEIEWNLIKYGIVK